jgi:cell division septation protein DedD
MCMRIDRMLLCCALVLAPQSANAQQQRPLLDQADGAIANGTFSEARGLLERWRRENPRPEQELQARYHVLAARMIADADSAEDAYLNVAVNYPTTRVAPEALLRLAQARFARGDSIQATAYLERLLSDYPDAELRPMAGVWLARVNPAPRNNRGLCQTLRSIGQGTNPETIDLLKAEIQRACGNAAVASSPSASVDTRSVRPDTSTRRAASAPPTSPSSSGSGKVAIQVGAFREAGGARAVKAQIERAGITDVRLVRVPGNQLIRVRVGRYANRAGAAAMLARLANADISAVLVTDADRETVVKD